MLQLKLQYFVIWCKKLTPREKVPAAGKTRGQEEKTASEDEMAGWHHWRSGQELEQTAGDGEGQGGLAWGAEEPDLTGQLNNNWANTGTNAENTGWEMNLPGWPMIRNHPEPGITCFPARTSLWLVSNHALVLFIYFSFCFGLHVWHIGPQSP